MAAYVIELEPHHDLPQLESQLRGEEAGGSEFKESNVSPHEGRETNLATFGELPPGQRPTELSLVDGPPPDPIPGGKTLVWSGDMLVQMRRQPVTALRATT